MLVELLGPSGWRSGPVRTARSVGERLRGLCPDPPGHGLLLRASSIQTFGMKVPLMVAGLDRAGTVGWVRTIPPRRLVVAGTAWMLELPVERSGPIPGWRLRVVPMLAG